MGIDYRGQINKSNKGDTDMKRYTVWMDVTETWKIWFDAENMDEALKIIKDLEHGDIESDDIEGYGDVNKGIESTYALDTLEEHDFTKAEETQVHYVSADEIFGEEN